LSYPAEIAQNKMCNAPVSLIDIFPTLIDLSGLPEKGDLDGNSLVPLLKNPTMDWDRPVLTTYGKGNHAVRSGKWRYIQYQDGGSELYDHQKDPNEWYNLSDKEDHREVVVELKAHLPNQEK
jgi:iduronate 2-sulfatase